MYVHDLVFSSGVPNYRGVRKPVGLSQFNLPLWRSLLDELHYDDLVVCDFLEFGWPVDFYGDIPLNEDAHRNHSGATLFPDDIDAYLFKEVTLYHSTVGPFVDPPFICPVALSPLNSVPKRGSRDRRVILDLSWPEHNSVNGGISAEFYQGQVISLTYPTVDMIADVIVAKGPGCFIYKRDLKRAYRQFPVDPRDCHLSGYRWKGLIYFDRVLPMGLRIWQPWPANVSLMLSQRFVRFTVTRSRTIWMISSALSVPGTLPFPPFNF